MSGDKISNIFKVKAHLTLKEAAEENETEFHAGNDLADHCANLALPTHNEAETNNYLKKDKVRSQEIPGAIEALIRADNGSPSMAGGERTERPKKTGAKVSKNHHTFR